MNDAPVPKKKRKGCFGCSWIFLVIFAAVFIAPFTIELLHEKWEISSALGNAKSVRLEHYRNSFETGKFDGKDEIIGTKELLPEGFPRVAGAFPIFPDIGIPGLTTGCIFNPHHRIVITDAAGNVTTISACFECDHISITHGNEKYGHIVGTPFVWMWSLRRFFSEEGMPNSPQLYRPQSSNESTNAPPTAAPQ